MKEVTAAEVREAALDSLELEEEELGTATLRVEKAEDGDWDLLYADSSGTFEGMAVVDTTGTIDVWWGQDDF